MGDIDSVLGLHTAHRGIPEGRKGRMKVTSMTRAGAVTLVGLEAVTTTIDTPIEDRLDHYTMIMIAKKVNQAGAEATIGAIWTRRGARD